MPGRNFLLERQRPAADQLRVAFGIAAALSAVCLAAYPFRNIQLPKFDGYVPAIESLMMLGDLITAAMLFSQASITRSKSLLVLAAAYWFSSLGAIPHILTFPGAFGPSGLLGVDASMSAWLFFGWRIALPLGVVAYALLGNRYWRIDGAVSSRNVVVLWVAGAALLALAITVVITKVRSLLPDLMSDATHFSPAQAISMCLAMAGVSLVAMAMVWRRYGSILDLWLLLMLWVIFLEYCMNASISGRFTLGWYVLKAFGCISSLLVLLLLLVQTNKLYLRLVIFTSDQERERQRQLLVRDAIAASIAHEMRQPLSAMLLNVEAALRMPPDKVFASGIIEDVLNDIHRAIDMISSTRDLYKNPASNIRPSNINQLIRDTLAMDARDLQSHGVTVELALAEPLPNAVINRLQMQHVFMNLFMNAAEAMNASVGPRILRVRSEVRDDNLVISVQDTGPGIESVHHHRIFNPFFTTKETGTGLGLAICQSVVEGHGGTLRAVQRSEPGAFFEIALPCKGTAVGTTVRVESGDVSSPSAAIAPSDALRQVPKPEHSVDKVPATLGDVLYAKSKTPVQEQVWARLVQSIAAGDQLALHELYEMAHRIVFTLILQITANRETSAELAIDVFYDVWRGASRYDAAKGTVLAWIMNQARSRAVDHLLFENREKGRHVGNIHVHAEMAADAQGHLALRIAQETGKEAVLPSSRQWSEPEWEQVAPGIECKLLATDTQRYRVSMLVRLAPGASYPAHTHAGVEELHLLDGELWIDERKLFPGDYNYGAPGAGDDRVWSATGCTCVLVTSTKDVLRV